MLLLAHEEICSDLLLLATKFLRFESKLCIMFLVRKIENTHLHFLAAMLMLNLKNQRMEKLFSIPFLTYIFKGSYKSLQIFFGKHASNLLQ